MTRAGWHYGSVDAVRNEAGVADQSDECRNGTKDCPGPDADVDELPCLECLADASDGDQEVATDGGECVEGTDQRSEKEHRIGDRPHVGGVTRGTVIEYDGWQWGVVTEIATEESPTKVGFVLIDELDDSIVRVLKDAWGCAEHYDAVKMFRWSEHEYWTDAEYLQADIWETLGPIHPQERDGNGRGVDTDADRSEGGEA